MGGHEIDLTLGHQDKNSDFFTSLRAMEARALIKLVRRDMHFIGTDDTKQSCKFHTDPT